MLYTEDIVSDEEADIVFTLREIRVWCGDYRETAHLAHTVCHFFVDRSPCCYGGTWEG